MLTSKEILKVLENIKSKLKDRRLSIVSEETNISYPTLKSLADGKNVDYKMTTIGTISNYLEKK